MRLLNLGYNLAIVKDAVATTIGGEEIGLDRMKQAGAVTSLAKGIYFEWLRSVTNSVELRKQHDIRMKVPNSIACK